MRLPVRLLGGGEVAAAPADLADLVVAGCRREHVVGLELGTRVDGLPLGLLPLAAEPEDLRTVHAAGAGKAGRPLDIAPPVRGLGPLAGALEVSDALGAGDGHAVDDGGREGVELTREGRRRRLVEQHEAGIELAQVDEAGALHHECERLDVGIAEPLADLERELRLFDRLVELAGDRQRLDGAHERCSAVLEPLRLVLEEALPLGQPAAREGKVRLDSVVEREPERHSRRPSGLRPRRDTP